jgi:hypothetical protein
MSNWWDADPVANAQPSARITITPQSRDLLARTVLGEAADEPDEGQAAVAAVIKNRLRSGKWGNDPLKVITARHQFEPWNTPQGLARMQSYKPDSPEYKRAAAAVDRVFNEDFDPTDGATHFFSPTAQAALGRQPPAWAQGSGLPIGRHTFYAPGGRMAASAQARNWWDADPVASSEQAAPEPEMQTAPGAPTSAPSARITVGPRPDIGRGRALAEGLRSGGTANFGDELAGVAAAAGTPDELRSPFSGASDAILGAIKLGYGALTGNDNAFKRYAAGRDEVRQAQKDAEEQYPGTNIAGQIGGAVMLPMGGLLNAATLPLRMARGAAVGAGYGGVSGLGAGTTAEDRATKAAVGTGMGGVFGGVGVPVVEGITRGIGAAVSKPAGYLRGAMNPQGSAERAIGRAYREATEADPNAINRLAPNELQPGAPQTVMDTLGQPGRDLARSAANISGGARDRLNQTLDDRYQNQAGRLTGWLRQTFNYPDVHAQRQAIQQTARGVNDPAYRHAMQDGSRGVWDAELQRLAGSPAIQQAARESIPSLANRGITEGFAAPRQNPLTFNRQTGLASLSQLPNGSQRVPDLRFWDQVKRNLDGMISKAENYRDNSRVAELTAVRNELLTNLDRLVPSYQQARAGAAHFFGADDALQAGQAYVTQNFATRETRAALARMTATERQLFQDGFVSRLVETLEGIPDRADVVRRIYNSPAAREKIQVALGRQRAQELEAMLRIENVMQQSLRAVQGNSTTALQIMTGGLAGAAGGGFMGFDPTTSGLAAALATAGKRGVDTRVANQIAEMLTSRDPAVLNRGIRMIAGSQRYMDVLRAADSATARIGGGQAPHVPLGSQVPAITRAEDEPKVPRPPGQ